MTEREALRLALEALKTLMIERGSIYDKAITAIKEALAQPEQKPRYGYKGKCNRVMSNGNPCGLNAPCPDCGLSLIDCPQPQPWEKFCDSNCVWTDHHPDCKLAERLPLTDEEIRLQWSEFWETECHPWAIEFARAIEAAHGIKGEA